MAAEQQTNKVAGGSRFAAACGLLRQYMMEQGGGRGAVTMGLMPGAQGVAAVVAPEERINKTMELFPQRAGTLKDERILQQPEMTERAQLTIFYGGSTVVFDDFPADKADELMQLANSIAGARPVCPDDVLLQPFLADMPVARKISLRRFLEKRKGRLAAADPYPPPTRAANYSAGKPVEDGGAPWLGINSVINLDY
uniref:Uncharacterized protein n=1 Tax=Avena sativa TaxID=4498 RepID=A0ACD5TUK6_AVESA